MTDIKKALSGFGSVTLESLAGYTSWQVGGEALCFAPDTIKSLLESITVLDDISWNILGGGSNVLFADGRLRSVILRLITSEFRTIKLAKNNLIYCGAGVKVAEVMSFLREHKLSALEFLAGLPASVGGLVQMNASFKGKSVADVLERVVVVDQRFKELVEIPVEQLDFAYRKSGLNGQIIVGAFFKAQKSETKQIESAINECLSYRASAQEWGVKTAGCVFKNPSVGISAGKLIDECGLKGFVYGDAMVSNKHANFIVNRGQAKSSDIVYLIEKIKEKVQIKKNIVLEEEIVRIEC